MSALPAIQTGWNRYQADLNEAEDRQKRIRERAISMTNDLLTGQKRITVSGFSVGTMVQTAHQFADDLINSLSAEDRLDLIRAVLTPSPAAGRCAAMALREKIDAEAEKVER